jgi:hypothetical protein
MYATKHFPWLNPFYEQLPYEHALSDWDEAAVKCFSSWGVNRFSVSIENVTLICDSDPNSDGYDLVAHLRATGMPQKFRWGCDGDLVVDAKMGLHVSDTKRLSRKMEHDHEALVLTRRCFNGHAEHFTSWGLPYYEEFLFVWARENIFRALGGFQEGRMLTNRKVFELLCDHIERNL